MPYSGAVNHAPKTANATFCATLCDQLWFDGLRAAFIAPGSRSTPLALALVAHNGISTEVFHDERAAAFAALGHGLATGSPGLVLCSSGTAGAHFYAAVIEAEASAVPLIVVTADRPPELWNRGAPQTIDQTNLYGTRVRDFVEPGPPDELDPSTWRAVARRLWVGATGSLPGPVHANLSFRDPLTGTPDDLPPRLPPHTPVESAPPDATLVQEIAKHLGAERGVVVVGRSETSSNHVMALAARLGWPVIADHRSGCRDPNDPRALRHFDSLLRADDFTETHRPDVVLRIGEIVSSKAVSQWLSASAAAGTFVIASRPHGRHIDPEAIAGLQFDERGYVAALHNHIRPERDNSWAAAWAEADQQAALAIAVIVDGGHQPNEIAIAQRTLEAVPAGGALVVSSSMPVRDVEWFGPSRADIDVYANRGANGIDGIIATAVGIALTGVPTVCLIGDVAFLHDSTSLAALAQRSIDLTIVVTDNDGGGIFSFLPQHELLDAEHYEQLFGTPHGTSLETLVQAHGLPCHAFGVGTSLQPDGVQVVIARTDRAENLALHDRAHAEVAETLTPN